ncbi:MAG: hypothetical protein ACK40K_05460, partial [Raineya sp.]
SDCLWCRGFGKSLIGMASIGGMLIGTILGVFVIPGLYVVMAELGKKKTKEITQNTKQTEKIEEEQLFNEKI